MGVIASQISSLKIAYSIVYSGADQSKHQSSASLAFVRGIHRGPVNSPHRWSVPRKMFPFDDVIMEPTFFQYHTGGTRYSMVGYARTTGHGCDKYDTYRADSMLAPSQWETALLCNDVSAWLGANVETVQYSTYTCAMRSPVTCRRFIQEVSIFQSECP